MQPFKFKPIDRKYPNPKHLSFLRIQGSDEATKNSLFNQPQKWTKIYTTHIKNTFTIINQLALHP